MQALSTTPHSGLAPASFFMVTSCQFLPAPSDSDQFLKYGILSTESLHMLASIFKHSSLCSVSSKPLSLAVYKNVINNGGKSREKKAVTGYGLRIQLQKC